MARIHEILNKPGVEVVTRNDMPRYVKGRKGITIDERQIGVVANLNPDTISQIRQEDILRPGDTIKAFEKLDRRHFRVATITVFPSKEAARAANKQK